MNKKEFKKLLLSGKMCEMVNEAITGEKLSSPDSIHKALTPLIAEHPGVENFYCVFLTAKNTVIEIRRMFTGSLTSCAVYPREIIKACLEVDACSLVLVHNHPSNDPEPSKEDISITKRIDQCCELMSIKLFDHIVIGGTSYTSMKQTGLMS
ncbi:MAG: DNA repair protein RadC [Deltaproteobacteria bacterium]|nr:DNA repair protein RadC [Deltaproteobacteria bacterium]